MYVNNSYSFLWLFSSPKRALTSQLFSLTAIRGNNGILTVMIEFCWRYFTSPYLKILKIDCRQEKNQHSSLLPLIRILSSAYYNSISAFFHLRFSIRILSSLFPHYIIRVFPSAIWSAVYTDLFLVSLGLVSIAKDCDCDSVTLYGPPRWRITHIYDTTSKLLLQTKLFWPQCKGFDVNKISFGNIMPAICTFAMAKVISAYCRLRPRHTVFFSCVPLWSFKAGGTSFFGFQLSTIFTLAYSMLQLQ